MCGEPWTTPGSQQQPARAAVRIMGAVRTRAGPRPAPEFAPVLLELRLRIKLGVVRSVPPAAHHTPGPPRGSPGSPRTTPRGSANPSRTTPDTATRRAGHGNHSLSPIRLDHFEIGLGERRE